MILTDKKYFTEYLNRIGNEIPELISAFNFSESKTDFSYLTKASAVYSSNIEGNSVDLNSFMNYELSKKKLKASREIKEIKNLIKAYEFAQNNPLNETNFLKCHFFLSETLLIKSKRGKYREEPVGVFDSSGLVYLAVEPEHVEKEMKLFFNGMEKLMKQKLSPQEIFYFASMLHLRLVHIHPFMDGNGRIARLFEKWFIASKAGKMYWKLPSEEYYWKNRDKYYNAINIGENFYELDYNKCVDFLALLPNCLR